MTNLSKKMGREIRRVPANWKHPVRVNPRTGKNEFHPAYQSDINEAIREHVEALKEYAEEYREFENGKEFSFEGRVYSKAKGNQYSDWAGEPPTAPDPRYFMPKGEWYQLYENVSEGTPLSPAFETPEELVDWLSSNADFWGNRWSREAAEGIVEDGFALSGIFSEGKLYAPHEQHLLK